MMFTLLKNMFALLVCLAFARVRAGSGDSTFHSLGKRHVELDWAEMSSNMADVVENYHERAIAKLAAGSSFFSINKNSFTMLV